ncbi:MAG: hypothetical protein AB7O59_10210 [Pirellulales bacterium]
MDFERIERLVNSVLYEGYLLYPYRRSLKNTRRWTIGSVYPAGSAEVRGGAERRCVRARCLVETKPNATVSGEVRLLQLIERRTGDASHAPAECWHEAIERRIEIAPVQLQRSAATQRQPFGYPAAHTCDVSLTESGAHQETVRRQVAIQGQIQVTVAPLRATVSQITVELANVSACAHDDDAAADDSALLQSFASAHVILHAQHGSFVSRIDPPAALRELCPVDPGDGLWPVLIGDSPERDTMLCSPIILYDYPELAPESPGDYFDATEIDEMLALRVMTLTPAEKLVVAALDERGRALLDRTENLARRQLAQLHGTTRGLRIVEESER